MNEELTAAFAAHVQSGAALLLAWEDGLTDERGGDLAGFRAKGLKLGLALTTDDRRVTVLLVDHTGAFTALERIEPGSPAAI